MKQPFAYRLGAALAVLTGRAQPCRCRTAASRPVDRYRVPPMATAIGLVTATSRDRSDVDDVNAVLAGVDPADYPEIAAAAAILAATLGRSWAAYDPTGPAETLGCIALVTAGKQ